YLFFFFQAEDGIRVFHVTGVQTCALPISPPCGPARSPPVEGQPKPCESALFSIQATQGTAEPGPRAAAARFPAAAESPPPPGSRSEERRVGKEWRSTRSLDPVEIIKANNQ